MYLCRGMTALEEQNLRRYYDQRAPEYEQIYLPRDQQHARELGELSRELREAVRERRVLEVACGTGYWTACAAGVALRVTATDASLAMLTEAREKSLPANVELLARDGYDLHDLPADFDAGLAMFWLSHVPRARLRAFLDGFHARLGAGAVVYLADNVYVPGLGGELLPADAAGDTYKLRRLSDGGRHRVLKNYFSSEELRSLLAPGTSDLVVRSGKHFWSATYRTGPRR
jgi:SAM-dependent methyltransferase